jgi:hypothetical protein
VFFGKTHLASPNSVSESITGHEALIYRPSGDGEGLPAQRKRRHYEHVAFLDELIRRLKC